MHSGQGRIGERKYIKAADIPLSHAGVRFIKKKMRQAITTARLFGLNEISPEEVLRRLEEPGFRMIDNNSCASFKRHHIPGARHLDPGDYGAGDLGSTKADTIVFYCSDALCGAAPYAAKRAKNMGFEHVYVMTKGISAWLKNGYPIIKSE
ncbi:rhodanese-like domain-containing protein [Chitinophaga deserti]|uniref:rhodanese-like domain-containing protein n=1 Tax=Chitinophaga deserti TaxID=2164099 RepID=UPI000D6C4A32